MSRNVDLNALRSKKSRPDMSPMVYREYKKDTQCPNTLRAIRHRQRQIRKNRVYKSVFYG